MQLRAFRYEDLDPLHRIDCGCFPPGVAYSRDELAGFIGHRHSKTWVAEEQNEIAGFVVANRTRTCMMHIITLDVKESWRRRGVGASLMNAAEAWGRQEGLRAISLETAEDNRAAQAFYEARGYVKIGETKNYYANGATAWIMGKRLR